MESNNELMILSLLNLYVSYVELKQGKPYVRPLHSRYPSNRLQFNKTINKERTAIKTNQKETLDNSSVVTLNAKSQTISPAVKIEKETTIENIRPATENFSALDMQNNDLNFTDLIESIGDQNLHTNELQLSNAIESITDKEMNTNFSRIVKRRKSRKGKEINSKRKPRKRRWRVRPINNDRVITGFQRKVFSSIKAMDQEKFFEHTRMTKPLFDWLLSYSTSSLKKGRQTIHAEERLVITLNYLAYGTPWQSIAFKHKVGKSTVRQIVLDTCKVLWTLLSPVYVYEPTTSQYGDIANDFYSKWDIPNCVGAIDCKLLPMRIPRGGSIKRDSRMLILGVCDAKYKFSAISVENFNNESDEEILKLSSYSSAIISDNLPLPSNKPLVSTSSPFPHYFIANTLFPLRKNIMRPYEGTELDDNQTIFNYKISHGQTVVENAFGILNARFRVLSTTLDYLPESSKIIILACIALHNYIMSNDEEQLYCPPNFVDHINESGVLELGEWRNEITKNGDKPLCSITSSNYRCFLEGQHLRDTLANFFASEAFEIEIV